MSKLVLILVALVAGVVCEAAEVQTTVLQYQLGRMYFPVGEEQQVYKGAPFVVYFGADTVASGRIAFAGPAISYSFPLDGAFDTLQLSSLHAVLQTADINLNDTIRLGYTGPLPACVSRVETDTMETGETADSLGLPQQPMEFVSYRSQLPMALDFESGKLDGFFSYSRYLSSEVAIAENSKAGYYAALVPDVSSHPEDNSFLTTSLYYRIDSSRYAVMFDGEKAVPANCLYDGTQDCLRAFPFDPSRGRSLLQHMSDRGRTFGICVGDESLQPAAVFLSDILSRDRLHTEIITDDNGCACHLIYVPLFDGHPDSSLDYIYRFLADDTVPGNEINKTIAVVGKYIELGQTASDETVKERFFQLAQKSLLEDIGVFPLFRPVLYFVANDGLKGCRFGSEGAFDTAVLHKIRPPTSVPEENE